MNRDRAVRPAASGLVLLLAAAACGSDVASPADGTVIRQPPFGGTIFIDADIITPTDPTAFRNLSDAGRGSRVMFDRRVNGWVTLDAFLFDATYDDGLTIEVQVNPEFGTTEAALLEAAKYAEVIGRLPTTLRKDVRTVWIHLGRWPFGGGNNNLLIHIGQADLYVADGILEETFVHEAAHTSLDADHALAAGWLAAQKADSVFISNYARDFPLREDIAESFLPYFAVRYRPDRISPNLAAVITRTIPNRIAYFDSQPFDAYPIAQPPVGAEPARHIVIQDRFDDLRRILASAGR